MFNIISFNFNIPEAVLKNRKIVRDQAYAPEGTVQGSEESRPQVGTSSKLSVKIAGRMEIGLFGIFLMASKEGDK